MSRVSVLIPARNVEATIERAINSALSQTGVEVEVIVAENGSTDYTALKVINIDDNRITFIQPDVDGVGATLNAAAQIATGEYFIELDADDYFAPDCLKKLVTALDGTPSHIGFAHGCIAYEGDVEMLYKPRPFRREHYWQSNACLYPFLYKRAAWDMGCRYHDHIFVEGRWISVQDWDMALQMTEYMRYEGVALPDTLVLHYTFRRNAQGQALGQKYNKELVAAFKQRWPMTTIERIG